MNKPLPWFAKFPGSNIDFMIVSVCSITEGLCGLLSLGFYAPNLGMLYLIWRLQQNTKAIKNKKEEEEDEV